MSYLIPEDMADEFTPPVDERLFSAVIANDPAGVKARLDAGINPDQPRGDHHQKTPLIHAAEGGCYECMRLLLEAGADVHLVGEDFRTPLRIAIERQDAQCVRLLLDHGADPGSTAVTKRPDGTKYAAGTTDLQVAGESTPEIMQIVSEADRKFALIRMAQEKVPPDPAAVQALLAGGIPVDLRDDNGHTALMQACINRHTAVVRLLLEYGANPEVTMDTATTALYFACKNTNRPPAPDIVKMLIDHGANPFRQGADGETLMHVAVTSGSGDIMKILVAAGVSLKAGDKKGVTPRDAAVSYRKGSYVPVVDEVIEWDLDHITKDAIKLRAPLRPMKKLRLVAPKPR
ncbi:MAG: ankyrin repeat domain-containing protein [Alphaproteobacteria bacterium]